MRIKFSNGEECYISGINVKGNTVAMGRYVAHEGVLCEGVEDITQYKTEIVDGEEVKVEVIPEVTEEDG